MTASVAHPYRPYIDVVRISTGGVMNTVETVRRLDTGLDQASVDELTTLGRSILLSVYGLLNRLIPLGLAALLISVVGWGRFWSPAAAGAGAAALLVGVLAEAKLRKAAKRINQLFGSLHASGALLAPWENTVTEDIDRIDKVLQALHARGDFSLDDRAREAVVKAASQHDREPRPKHSRIAASDATDEATTAIRALVKEQTALSAADVAAAELAITAFEAAAAEALRK
ncbi:hypothetical protein [Pseudarthrobacter sp. BIM B-2242]|uniref:hypothetical protein n=1 Tax=Pseudarthrobacter sp. BIM B-2242 TaxID=2772401 RepID=UPI00168C048C|nr:hypothetical protein [Pseudarthrobacter sp. BIM B-2242]QOD05652.1 hypothetical protein IDT60_21660 [Pseudarthrobacter sp. BIM B-2242]